MMFDKILTVGSLDSVTIYLLEPKTCEYVLGVESSIMCAAMQLAVARRIGMEVEEGEDVPPREPEAEPQPEPRPSEDRADRAPNSTVVQFPLSEQARAKVAELRGNVNDVSQKVVEGYFHMILTVELEPGVGFDAFKTELECLSSPESLAVRVMNERIFRFMHRV